MGPNTSFSLEREGPIAKTVLGGVVTLTDALASGEIVVDSNEALVTQLFESLTDFRVFPLIEPHGASVK